RFKSSLWTNQQWFLKRQHWSCDDDDDNDLAGIFHSIHSYRRKPYELNHSIDSLIHFSNASKLTLIENDIESSGRSIININSFIPLIQVTHLVIRDAYFTISQLIQLLRFSLNIQSLTLIDMVLMDKYTLSIEQIYQIRSISKTSKVTELSIQDDCSLSYLHFFVDLCSRLQRSKVVAVESQVKSIVQFLLSGKVPNLFWLCLGKFTYEKSKQIQTMIDHDKLIFDYNITDHYTGIYLWW
ncbi:unnamed protein product, partial [Rotaria sp. Silwood1]